MGTIFSGISDTSAGILLEEVEEGWGESVRGDGIFEEG